MYLSHYGLEFSHALIVSGRGTLAVVVPLLVGHESGLVDSMIPSSTI